jgi:PKD repeat protein
MKKTILLFFLSTLFAFIANFAKAQCTAPVCPPFFIIRDSVGCDSVEIRRNPPVSGYSNGTFPLRACKNSKMKYTLTPALASCYPVINYSFISISGGTLVNLMSNMFTVQWGASPTGAIKLEFSTPGSAGSAPCKDTMTLNFTLINSPIAAFTATPQPVCFNNPTLINFNSTGTLNATNYFWNFGDSYTSILANPTHAYTSPGTYIVTLIVSNAPIFNGQPPCLTCVDSIKKTVVVDNLPGPPIPCVATVCAGDTVTYCTTAAPCGSYLWNITGGVPIGPVNGSCVTVKWGSGNPQGTINLQATGCPTTYCPQGTTVTVPTIPASGTISGASVVCINTTENYTLPAWPGTTYSWTLSSGGVISPYNTNTNVISINWNVFGTHLITCNYFDTALNCGGTATYTVSVLPNLSISGPTAICVNQTSNLNATRPVGVPVPSNWIIPPGVTLNSGAGTGTVNLTWNVPGVYVIQAAAVTPGVVCSPASYTVTVLPAPVLSSINGKDSICPGKTYVYSATSNLTGFYSWSITGASGVPSFLGVNNDSVQITWNLTGPYSISVTQFSIPGNCASNTLVKNIFPYPTPIITGPTTVCADAIVTYTITNIANGNFNWFVTPPSFGTILSGQGTPSISIKWHGNNSPGTSNVVYLHFGVCGKDSIKITINEPTVVTINPAGTLCGGGISLTTVPGSTYAWTGPGVPPPGNTLTISGITVPGTYTVNVTNIGGTGCNGTASYTIPNTGLPVASISATNVLNYCLPNTPNMNLVAVNGPGYTFQWYNSAGMITGATFPTLLINTLTLAGTYTYYCVVKLGSCVVTSNTIFINITNGPCGGGPGPCSGSAINITSITGCNPFTLGFAAVAPATLVGTGNPSVTHLEDNYTLSGDTTRTYSSIGYKQVRICADVQSPFCRVCKDTVVNVTVAANFTKVVNCKSVSLFDASTVVFPATINTYNWTVGTNPGNFAVPPFIASYNNPTIANPVLTITQTGSYIITQTITSGSCVVVHRDTVNMTIPNADFAVTNSCVGTTVNLNNLFPAPTNFWDFGDAATSYTSPTAHAYGAPGIYNITHIVTIANGCKDTVVKPITIVAPPVCTVTSSGPLTFCFKDSVILGSSCTGLTNYQWYNNGVAIPGQIFATDTVKQTGNYSFIAFDINGCKVVSDTVTVTVLQAPNVAITTAGSYCAGSSYTTSVPNCFGCTYQWSVNGIAIPGATTSSYAGTAGIPPFSIGTHNIAIQVTNGLGCSDTSSINVTFYALPTVSITVVGPTPYCSNNIYTLNATSSAASPSWAWNFNNIGFVLSTTNTLVVSAAGNYTVKVTDGITGCMNTAVQTILPSPELNLFPIGCDSLCDSSKIFLPLQSFNGILTGYTIDWYDNAPPYLLPVGTGISFPLSSLPVGNHNLSVIVTSPNGCKDTSNVYSINTRNCSVTLPIKELGEIALVNWSTEQEIDNDYFIVERSTNGTNFAYAGKVWSKGNSFFKQYYAFNDPILVFNQSIYYRIKVVDKNGQITYSNIVKLNPGKQTKESLLIVPNITADKTTLLLQSNSSLPTDIIIYATNGTFVKKIPLVLTKGVNSMVVNFTDLASGLYWISIKTNEGVLTGQVLKK